MKTEKQAPANVRIVELASDGLPSLISPNSVRSTGREQAPHQWQLHFSRKCILKVSETEVHHCGELGMASCSTPFSRDLTIPHLEYVLACFLFATMAQLNWS